MVIIMLLGRIVTLVMLLRSKQTTTALSICVYLNAGHKMIVLVAVVSLQG